AQHCGFSSRGTRRALKRYSERELRSAFVVVEPGWHRIRASYPDKQKECKFHNLRNLILTVLAFDTCRTDANLSRMSGDSPDHPPSVWMLKSFCRSPVGWSREAVDLP